MRNLFDQYAHPENRLSHALAVCLHEDPRLLRRFLRWHRLDAPAKRLTVLEQTLPGESPPPEAEAERRGLPDIVIHDDDGWCALIESKVQAPSTLDQLRRHASTVRRRGFRDVTAIALTKAGATVPPGVRHLTWTDIYAWLGGDGDGDGGEWPRRLREYLRIAEANLARDGYLTEGTLTMFDGFHFDEDHPYTYAEAKRLLGLVMKELRTRPALRKLGVDHNAPGRPGITGRDAEAVWDFLVLRDRPKSKSHAAHPHLTLDIHRDYLGVQLAIPNGVPASMRKRLASLGANGLAALHKAMLRQLKRSLPKKAEAVAFAVQRRFPSQRATPENHARLEFRLETGLRGGANRVREQPEWLEAFIASLNSKRSNLHFGYLVKIPWGVPELNSAGAVDLIAAIWTGLRPALDTMRAPARR